MPRLPILSIAKDAYLIPLTRLRLVLASAWLHVVVSFAASFIPSMGASGQFMTPGSVARSVAWCFTAAPVALAWHRWVLLGEPISAGSALRFDARALRFALLLLLVDVAVSYLLVNLMWLAVAETKDAAGAIVRTLGPLTMVVVTAALAIPSVISTAVLARFLLAFPLCALDRRAHLLRSAWRMSKGTAAQIFAVAALTMLPLAVLPIAPFYLYIWTGEFSLTGEPWRWLALMAALITPLSVLSDLLSVPIAACAASLVYRAISSDRPGAPGGASPEPSPAF